MSPDRRSPGIRSDDHHPRPDDHPRADDLALVALGEADAVEAHAGHVRGCPACTSDVQGLTAVVSTARSVEPGDRLVEPPARVWNGIELTLGLGATGPHRREQATLGGPSAVSFADVAARRPGRRTWGRVSFLAAAACAAGLLIGLSATSVTDVFRRTERVVATVDLAPLGNSPVQAAGEVLEDAGGRRVRLTVAGAPRQRGAYYQAWLLDPVSTRMVSLGALQTGRDGTTLPVPEGLDLGAYPTVDISVEPLDGKPEHSGASVARGVLVRG